MKKLFALLCLSSFISCEPVLAQVLYQDRWEIFNHTRITVNNGVEYIEGTACCTPFEQDLKVYSDGINIFPQGGTMHVGDYFEAGLLDINCPHAELISGYKSNYYPQTCGLPFPYENIGGVATNVVSQGRYGYNPAQYDTLVSSYNPNTNVAFAPCLPDSFPVYIGLTVGRRDCYFGNRTVNISGLANGFYIYFQNVNIPASVPDRLPDLHKFQCVIEITGTYPNRSLTFHPETPITACCSATIPPAPINLKITQRNRLSWDAVPGATYYEIYRAAASKFRGDWVIASPPIEIAETGLTVFQFDILPGNWAYYVKAENCAGLSVLSIPVFK